ncbi:hypothetical protein CSC94_19430 [Zhengella mangrovi]|uniref:Major facilitator superfamily (MFS) profile domain-containing protein n=1 Tax=Zhengella mangrovi TaxID=1982044 RepID=A0A2G1QIG3_9HYPH|nr:hypothetical protein [Zhengella mangrovi]PHP65302.1 hypothetical protein CSC94_19430 [Zhengella mangrovi]
MHQRHFLFLFLLAGVVALAAALRLYLIPLTGVTGTAGAALAVLSALALIVAGIVLLTSDRPALRGLFLVLSFLGAAGLLAAGWFLHGWIIVAAMGVALLALLGLLVSRPETKATA